MTNEKKMRKKKKKMLKIKLDPPGSVAATLWLSSGALENYQKTVNGIYKNKKILCYQNEVFYIGT